jgi:hypothetical protein
MIGLAKERKLRKKVCSQVCGSLRSGLMLTFIQQISTGVNSVRSDDTSGLKSKILSYLNIDQTVPLQPTILPQGTKFDRGWNHPATASLLCPLEYPATERYNLSHSFYM